MAKPTEAIKEVFKAEGLEPPERWQPRRGPSLSTAWLKDLKPFDDWCGFSRPDERNHLFLYGEIVFAEVMDAFRSAEPDAWLRTKNAMRYFLRLAREDGSITWDWSDAEVHGRTTMRLHLDRELSRKIRHAAVDRELSLSALCGTILEAAIAQSTSEPAKVAK